DQKDQFVKYVTENYIPKKRIDDFSIVFLKHGDKKNLKYIEKLSKKDELIDKAILGKWYREKYILNTSKSRNFSHLVSHVIFICKESNIEWFTNNRFNNIYVYKKDKSKYLQHYDFMKDVVTSGDYYTNQEVQKLFGIYNTDSVANYAGATTFGQKRFIKKDKTDELYSISENTKFVAELTNELGLSRSAVLFNALKELNIEVIDWLPLGNGTRI